MNSCRACKHSRKSHWWQEPSHPDGGILRCKTCEARGRMCLASYTPNGDTHE
jgi:hypothetical protein